ncbi:Uncharacterised protein [uncultured archaeon]|nr:Uncharacterised protein [uncultured archaeon]
MPLTNKKTVGAIAVIAIIAVAFVLLDSANVFWSSGLPGSPSAGAYYAGSAPHTVNTVSAHGLSKTRDSPTTNSYITIPAARHLQLGIRVYVVHSDGSKTELTTSPQAMALFDGIMPEDMLNDPLLSATSLWTPPATNLVATDALMISLYEKVDSNGWTQLRSTDGVPTNFITPLMQASSLKATPWNVYYAHEFTTNGMSLSGKVYLNGVSGTTPQTTYFDGIQVTNAAQTTPTPTATSTPTQTPTQPTPTPNQQTVIGTNPTPTPTLRPTPNPTLYTGEDPNLYANQNAQSQLTLESIFTTPITIPVLDITVPSMYLIAVFAIALIAVVGYYYATKKP